MGQLEACSHSGLPLQATLNMHSLVWALGEGEHCRLASLGMVPPRWSCTGLRPPGVIICSAIPCLYLSHMLLLCGRQWKVQASARHPDTCTVCHPAGCCCSPAHSGSEPLATCIRCLPGACCSAPSLSQSMPPPGVPVPAPSTLLSQAGIGSCVSAAGTPRGSASTAAVSGRQTSAPPADAGYPHD